MLLSTRGLWKVQRTTGLPAHINLPKCTHQQRCSRRWKVRAAGQAGGEAPSLKDPEDGCSGLFPLPQDFLRDLASREGVKVVFQSPEEVDEDEEDWDEVMSELSDPWMAEPPAPPEEFVVQEDPEVLAAAAATSAAAAALPIAEVQLVQGLAELEQLQAQAQQGSQPLVLLDVRSQEQFEEGHLPGCRCIPIKELSGATAQGLASSVIVIIGSGDYKGSQASIRMTKVYRCQQVHYYEKALEDWAGAGRQLAKGSS